MLFDWRIDFWSFAFARAASSEFCLLLFSLPTVLLLSLMSAFHHLFDLAQILSFFAMALRTLLIASWHHAASCSTLSSVYSASSWALSFASSIHSFSTASASFSVIAARFHPITLSWSASSCRSTLTSHSITSWSHPVAWLSASMVHFTIGQFASVRPMTDSPSWFSLVQ